MKITREQKIEYMRIAVNILGFGFKLEHVDELVTLYEKILEKGHDTDLKDIAEIKHEVQKRHKKNGTI